MKKLNAYLMGMMSVAVCLFSVACSSDDEETAPKENGQVVTVEAVFANDGLTRAAIGEPDGETKIRHLSFEEGDVLKLVPTVEGDANGKSSLDFGSKKVNDAANAKIIFTGTLHAGTDFDDYTAYLISKENTSGIPSYSTIGTVRSSLDDAFNLDAIICGDYNKSTSKYVISLQNAFVVKTTTGSATFNYGTSSADQPSESLSQGNAVAVRAGIKLKSSKGVDSDAAANTIYAF